MVIGKGRMARSLVDRVGDVEGRRIANCLGRKDNLKLIVEWKANVVIDFSSPAAILDYAPICLFNRIPMVIGTTGHDQPQRKVILDCAEVIPVVFSSNYSEEMNLLFDIVARAARILGATATYGVDEIHHDQKKDAPSGSAKTLARIISKETGKPLSEISMSSLRGGDVIGNHTVKLLGKGEILELTHRASTRDTFANGALKAADWVRGKSPGLYDMQDVLGLKVSK